MKMVATTQRIVIMNASSIATTTIIDTESRRDLRSVEFTFTADTFLYVASGEITYRYNGRSGRLIDNSLIAMPPGLRVSSLSARREMYSIVVRNTRITATDQRGFTPFFERTLSPQDGKDVCAMMRRASECTAAEAFGEDDVACLKRNLLPFFWRRSRDATQSSLRDLSESLWHRLSKPLSVARLAAEIGYTTNYLSDLVREHTGNTMGAWIADMRMARARALLEQTDEAVANVGARCGYDDPGYFARMFRGMHGVSPGAWRVAARPLDARHSAITLAFDAFLNLDSTHLNGRRTDA